ncbi:MAG TPA: hypothetical protein VGY53_02200 [Isosphaeraceae bacterium]|nr:hypothetical protein [Isosphaeraceae bacterium]
MPSQPAQIADSPPAPPAGAPPGGLPAPPPASPAKRELPTEAEKAVDEAIAKVATITSVSADITQTVDMLGQQFELRGRFIKAPQYRIYTRLNVYGLGETSGEILQVCDGKTLWDYRQILGTDRTYSRLDLAKVLAKLNGREFHADLRRPALERVGFAGPETLLLGLRNALRFTAKEADTLDGKAVWIVRGQWKDLASLTGPSQPPIAPNALLPAYIPSLAQVWIGQEDGWPYRVWLEGRRPSIRDDIDEREIGPDGKRIGRKGLARQVEVSKLVLNYSKVKLNPVVPESTFAIPPAPNVSVLDRTDPFLVLLERDWAQYQADQHNAAPKESELPRTIPVPGVAPDLPLPVRRANPAPLEKVPVAPRS